jgi:thiamine-monophosphate kinase
MQLARMAENSQRQIAALDVSDGLAGDLGHILASSGVGAILNMSALPLSPALQTLPPELALECFMHGGDDYELVFTAPKSWRQTLESLDLRTTVPVHRIGYITADSGLHLTDHQGLCQPWQAKGYDHFST